MAGATSSLKHGPKPSTTVSLATGYTRAFGTDICLTSCIKQNRIQNHTYIHTFKNACIYAFLCIYMHYMHIFVYTYLFIHIHILMYTFTDVCLHFSHYLLVYRKLHIQPLSIHIYMYRST